VAVTDSPTIPAGGYCIQLRRFLGRARR
jgi:hypothetical protein